MDIVIITNGKRAEYLMQTLWSLDENCVDFRDHSITVVLDGCKDPSEPYALLHSTGVARALILAEAGGASRARNCGADSVGKLPRQKYVMFLDDDVYMMPGWDRDITRVLDTLPGIIVSGHSHPFNQAAGPYNYGKPGAGAAGADPVSITIPGVLSTVHLAMEWSTWDRVGYFIEPGGPGGSEDVNWCARAVELGYGLAVTEPHCVIHCGLTSSSGNQIVGYDLMVEQNDKLVRQHNLGRVVYV